MSSVQRKPDREGTPDPREACWRVVRQDDNGNQFLVEAGLTEPDARRQVLEFESHGHKQTYWVEPMPREKPPQPPAE